MNRPPGIRLSLVRLSPRTRLVPCWPGTPAVAPVALLAVTSGGTDWLRVHHINASADNHSIGLTSAEDSGGPLSGAGTAGARPAGPGAGSNAPGDAGTRSKVTVRCCARTAGAVRASPTRPATRPRQRG